MSDLITCEAMARKVIETLGLTNKLSGDDEDQSEAIYKMVEALSYEERVNIWLTCDAPVDLRFDLELTHDDKNRDTTNLAVFSLDDMIAHILEPSTPQNPEFVDVG